METSPSYISKLTEFGKCYILQVKFNKMLSNCRVFQAAHSSLQ